MTFDKKLILIPILPTIVDLSDGKKVKKVLLLIYDPPSITIKYYVFCGCMWDFRFFFFLSAELANSLEPSNGRGPFVRELIKHSSQKSTKYRDSIDDDSKLTICPFTVRLVHSMPKDTLCM